MILFMGLEAPAAAVAVAAPAAAVAASLVVIRVAAHLLRLEHLSEAVKYLSATVHYYFFNWV